MGGILNRDAERDSWKGAVYPHHITRLFPFYTSKKGQLTQMDKLPLFYGYACRDGQMRLHDLKIIGEIRICDIVIIDIMQDHLTRAIH